MITGPPCVLCTLDSNFRLEGVHHLPETYLYRGTSLCLRHLHEAVAEESGDDSLGALVQRYRDPSIDQLVGDDQ